MNRFDYIVACVHLYGMVHEDRIMTIYNKHHPQAKINKIGKHNKKTLEEEFVYYEDGFYIHQALYYHNDMADHLKHTNGKPYYLPNELELEKYLDNEYYERKPSMDRLYDYVNSHMVLNNPLLVEELVDDIVVFASGGASMKVILEEFNRRDISFEENQIEDVVSLINYVYNDCKMWTNNGFSPNEFIAYNKRFEKTKRNDLCPCQSGKKFKQCCLNKGYIDDGLGDLEYENVFIKKDKRKSVFRNSLLFEMEFLDDDFLDLEDPSYIDMIDDFLEAFYDKDKEYNSKVISGALIRSLLVYHEYEDLEDRYEDILRRLKVWSKRKEVFKVHQEIEKLFFGIEQLNSTTNLLAMILKVFDDLGYKDDKMYIDDNNYEGLLKSLKNKKYDIVKTSILTDLAFDVFDSDLPQKNVVLHHFLQITPFLPQTIAMLLDEFLNEQSKLNLLNAYIKAYEEVNKEDFINPIKEFTRYKDHKQYILGLDSLAYAYKSEGEWGLAIETYDKILAYDDEDRFGAKEASLICFIHLHQMDKFSQCVNDLKEDSLYKVFLELLFSLVRDEPYEENYLNAYNKNPLLLDVICGFKELNGHDVLPIERDFIDEFYDLFVEKENLMEKLISIHQEHKRSMA